MPIQQPKRPHSDVGEASYCLPLSIAASEFGNVPHIISDIYVAFVLMVKLSQQMLCFWQLYH